MKSYISSPKYTNVKKQWIKSCQDLGKSPFKTWPLVLTTENKWEEPFPVSSGEQGVWWEDGDILRSTAGGVESSGFSWHTTDTPKDAGVWAVIGLSYLITRSQAWWKTLQVRLYQNRVTERKGNSVTYTYQKTLKTLTGDMKKIAYLVTMSHVKGWNREVLKLMWLGTKKRKKYLLQESNNDG